MLEFIERSYLENFAFLILINLEFFFKFAKFAFASAMNLFVEY